MKISIAVLDADDKQKNATLKMIGCYGGRRCIEIVCDGYASGMELLDATAAYGAYDIYILETNLPDMSGFYIAHKLRSDFSNCKIVYYTDNRSGAVNAFEVAANNYLIKPVSAEKFDRTLDEVIENIEREHCTNLVEVKVRTGYVRIPANDIAYVNIVNRALCYHMRDGSTVRSVLLREPFRNAVEILTGQPDFYIIGASLLINMAAVRVLNKNTILFSHGELITPPRDAFRKVRRRFIALH